jgi:hypothetical protein
MIRSRPDPQFRTELADAFAAQALAHAAKVGYILPASPSLLARENWVGEFRQPISPVTLQRPEKRNAPQPEVESNAAFTVPGRHRR